MPGIPRIEIAGDARNNGFAGMLAQLLSQNMEADGKKAAAFRGITGTISIEAGDLGERVSLHFRGDGLTLGLGLSPGALLTITSDSLTILDMARLKIRAGLPWFFDEVGRGILRKLVTGGLRVKGMFSHPVVLVRLTKIFSVG